MGSQTLEILRQGFWASLTGGWFFDPHQDIFCNTFHMYLWLILLLTPFVLYLTCESTSLPMIFYSLIICLVFFFIKVINYKLHKLFDGEELLDNKNIIKKLDGNAEIIELDVFSAGEKNANSDVEFSNVSLKKEIEDILGQDISNDKDCKTLSTLSLHDIASNSLLDDQHANEITVDFHHPKFVETNIHEKNTEVEYEDIKGSDYLTIIKESEDQPTQSTTVEILKECEMKISSENNPIQIDNLTVKKSFSFSRDVAVCACCSNSSWGDSVCAEVRESSLKYFESEKEKLPTSEKELEVKSENTLPTLLKNIETDLSNDKTVSMPALEVKEDIGNSRRFKGYNVYAESVRSKTAQGIWFSLPEIENSSIENISLLNCEAADLKSDKFSAIVEDSNSSGHLDHKKCEAESGIDLEAFDKPFCRVPRRSVCYAYNSSNSFHRRRSNAFSDRSLSRLHSQVSFQTPDNSENTLEEVGTNSKGKYVAMSHEDTSSGAVHCFRDEFGNWYSYTFGDDTASGGLQEIFSTEDLPTDGPSSPIQASLRERAKQQERTRALESSQPSTTIEASENGATTSCALPDIVPDVTYSWEGFRSQLHAGLPSIKTDITKPLVNKYYMLPVIGNFSLKVSFDRLQLLAIFDRNKNIMQITTSVLLATLVAALGYLLITRNYFYDFWLFVICFVIAKCQFSLLKSVQPDSASPVHGHNAAIAFNRAIYFCLVAILIIVADEASMISPNSITLYHMSLYSKATLEFSRDLLLGFLLAFPLVFLLGLLPQFNTFIMHILEQLDMHVFGGSAHTSLQASFFSMCRNLFFAVFLSCFCYFPLEFTPQGTPRGQNVLFSFFTGLLVAVSYHLSRSTSNPEVLLKLLKKKICLKEDPNNPLETYDPLPEKLMHTVTTRLIHDSIACFLVIFIVFAVHLSTVFTSLKDLIYFLYTITGGLGILLHYLLPQLRKQLPWLILSSPVLKSYEYSLFECQEHSRIMWFEKVYVWFVIIEKNILYPLICMSAMTIFADELADKFGSILASAIITITSMKLLRSAFSNTVHQHVVLIWTVLFFGYDYYGYSETFLIDYFIMAIFVEKMLELHLKFKFIMTYTAPWQMAWGSAFHAFAQPFSVPHCGMLFIQSIVSTFFSAPLNPFLGSAIFITSYMRPVKFWEKDYNTKRVDHSNTRFSMQIDSNPGSDDNNLNSIFYEHLTRSLQNSLCGDLLLGRWGKFASGDCFIMASYNLNALVHIIEVGNGFVTFQLRGLEFRGTYCQQREVEAITEDVDDDKGFCCFQPGHAANMLSLNSCFSQHWLAWEVAQSKYIVEGYSVNDNTASTMFQLFDLRKVFVTYYVTSIIFYCIRNKKLKQWLSDSSLMGQLNDLKSADFVDLDAIFRPVTDKDYDLTSGGITRERFLQNYHEWIKCCNEKRVNDKVEEDGAESNLVTLCFALSLLGRRLLSTASNNQWNASLKSFLHGLHSLFKGDFRVTAIKDEWIFSDSDLALLRSVVAPAVRMALKLHQDHFTCIDEYENDKVMYDAISQHEENFVICHEGNPEWRQAVLQNRSNLLALRYVMDDGNDDYKIIMLVKRCLNFRVIKVNKECVRGLWAGQLQELIFLRNRNPERGSIQNAKQALRNMINSSCDQPIGYPIYVSPLTTSYADTNPFFCKISVGNLNTKTIKSFFERIYRGIINQYAGHCHRSGGESDEDMTFQDQDGKASTSRVVKAGRSNRLNHRSSSYTSIPTSSNEGGSGSMTEDLRLSNVKGKARLVDITCVTAALSSKAKRDLLWPNMQWMLEVNRWDGWYPHKNMIGDILYYWEPNSSDPERRCNIDKKIYLLRIENYIVPVTEDGIVLLSDNLLEVKL
ncbi:pecanex-like protein 3 isoform X2 [Hydra vulgaris]|uniref:pecanex-like protein 3 isoform X2 n=1 Tax=Hydra vulgaris TaxID=6087 RepID=UPI001F5F27CE|nr:pecanex-like protein 3 isoform X1 [Hydra vulgaris]